MTTQHLASYLEASAVACARHVALVESGGRSITYQDLNQQANALAGFLSERGVKPGDRVGVVLPKGVPAVVALFGIMKAGAVFVPVDYTAPPERRRRILEDCAIRALIADARALDALTENSATSLAALIVSGDTDADLAAKRPDITNLTTVLQSTGRPPVRERSPDEIAYIIYTSGSTGMPKGAMITHGNAVSFVDWCSTVLQPTESDRFSSHTPFHFDASVQDIYPAIKHGATLHLISEELAKAPKDLAKFIADRALTIWTSTPSALMMLLRFGSLTEGRYSSLRIVAFGGEVFPVKHLRELKRVWPQPAYFNVYGPTETTTTCAFARIPSVVPDDRDAPYPIGFPCSHCEALVLDENGEEASEGLLHISGPSVFAGYWNRPKETAAAFINRSGRRWYNTGDVVRWDPAEGFTFVGRKDGMVKRRGFRIEMGEIERALYQHPLVREAAAVSIPDPESGVKIVAFVSCPAQKPSIVDLKTFCSKTLPSYMTPDLFIFEERLPRTSTDKMDYQLLAGRVRSAGAA